MEDATELRTGSSSLLKAVWLRRLRLTRLLLEGGAYVNESNEKGETALMAACATSHVDQQTVGKAKMVRYLLDNHADPNIQDKAGKTALMHACLQGAGAEVVSLLLENGANPSLEDHAGASALVHAINAGDEDVLGCLLSACKAKGQEVIIITTGKSASCLKSHRLGAQPSLDTCTDPSSTNPKPASLNSFQVVQEDTVSFHSPLPRGCPILKSPQELPPSPARKGGSTRRACLPKLKRLQSEPWGLVAPSSLAASSYPSDKRRVCSEKGLTSVGAAFPRKGSLTSPGQDSALFPPRDDQAARISPPSAPGSRKSPHDKSHLAPQSTLPSEADTADGASLGAAILEENAATTTLFWRAPSPEQHDCNSPLDCKASSSVPPEPAKERRVLGGWHWAAREALESVHSRSVGTAGRRPPHLLERRGSGTLLLDHISQTRPGCLPPLNVNPNPPIPDIGSASSPLAGSARPGLIRAPTSPRRADPRAKRALLRRHSMQVEQMKQLSNSEEIAAQ